MFLLSNYHFSFSSYIPSKFMEVVVNEVGATKINFILLPSDAVEGIL